PPAVRVIAALPAACAASPLFIAMEPPQPARRVVVTGLGAIHGLGFDAESFCASLLAGKNGIDRVTSFDPAGYATQVGSEVRGWNVEEHMDPKEARRNDRYTHFGYCAAKQAVADSGLDLSAEDPDRVGVLAGSGIGGMLTSA